MGVRDSANPSANVAAARSNARAPAYASAICFDTAKITDANKDGEVTALEAAAAAASPAIVLDTEDEGLHAGKRWRAGEPARRAHKIAQLASEAAALVIEQGEKTPDEVEERMLRGLSAARAGGEASW